MNYKKTLELGQILIPKRANWSGFHELMALKPVEAELILPCQGKREAGESPRSVVYHPWNMLISYWKPFQKQKAFSGPTLINVT